MQSRRMQSEAIEADYGMQNRILPLNSRVAPWWVAFSDACWSMPVRIIAGRWLR